MKVKIIREEPGRVLVEWIEDGELQRSILPNNLVDAEGNCDDPNVGMPYGIDLLPLITISVSPEDIIRVLHNAGIWTVDEILDNPKVVQGAINTAYGAVLGDLLANVMNVKQRS